MSHWESIRKEWTLNHIPYSPDAQTESKYSVDHYDTIFNCLVDGKPPKNPLKLGFVVKILNHGWKAEGLFTPPSGYIKGPETE